MEKTTITIDGDTLDRFKELKDELDDAQPDVPDHSANSFLNELLDVWERGDHDAPVPVDLRGDDYGDSRVMDVADELAKLREQVDKLPDRTADQLEGRFR